LVLSADQILSGKGGTYSDNDNDDDIVA
jgi:hypothetical protein